MERGLSIGESHEAAALTVLRSSDLAGATWAGRVMDTAAYHMGPATCPPASIHEGGKEGCEYDENCSLSSHLTSVVVEADHQHFPQLRYMQIQAINGVVGKGRVASGIVMAARLPSNPSTGSSTFHLPEASPESGF